MGLTFQTVPPSSLLESSENGHRLPRPPTDPQNPPGPQAEGWAVTLRPHRATPRLLCRASSCAPWQQVWGVCSPENPPGQRPPPRSSAGRARAPLTPWGKARLGASFGPENSSLWCHWFVSPVRVTGKQRPQARACWGGGPGLGAGFRPQARFSPSAPSQTWAVLTHHGLPWGALMCCETRPGDGGLSAAGLSGRAPATSLPVAGAGSQRAEMTFLGRLGTDPFRAGGRKAGSAQGQSRLAVRSQGPEHRKGLWPAQPPQPRLQSSPPAVGTECQLVTASCPCPRLLGRVSEARGAWLPQTQHFRQLEEWACSPAPSLPRPHLRDNSCGRPGRGRGRGTCCGLQATMPGTRGEQRWPAHRKISPEPTADVLSAAGLTQAADALTRKARAGRRARAPLPRGPAPASCPRSPLRFAPTEGPAQWRQAVWPEAAAALRSSARPWQPQDVAGPLSSGDLAARQAEGPGPRAPSALSRPASSSVLHGKTPSG